MNGMIHSQLSEDKTGSFQPKYKKSIFPLTPRGVFPGEYVNDFLCSLPFGCLQDFDLIETWWKDGTWKTSWTLGSDTFEKWHHNTMEVWGFWDVDTRNCPHQRVRTFSSFSLSHLKNAARDSAVRHVHNNTDIQSVQTRMWGIKPAAENNNKSSPPSPDHQNSCLLSKAAFRHAQNSGVPPYLLQRRWMCEPSETSSTWPPGINSVELQEKWIDFTLRSCLNTAPFGVFVSVFYTCDTFISSCDICICIQHLRFRRISRVK